MKNNLSLLLLMLLFGATPDLLFSQTDNSKEYNFTFFEETGVLNLNFESDLEFYFLNGYILNPERYKIEIQSKAIDEVGLKVSFLDTGTFKIKLKGLNQDFPTVKVTKDKPQSPIYITIRVNTILDNFEAYDIISLEQIKNSGRTNLTDILHYYIPGFYGLPQTIADGTDHIVPVAFRSLSPDQLLVLVNGKRLHGTALLNINGTVGRGTVGKDLNIIPVIAIEKIEFYKAGAGVRFGSDAIAGVINISLKESVDQTIFDFKIGSTSDGDGAESRISMHSGVDLNNHGTINFSGEYTQMDAYNRTGQYSGKTIYGDMRDDSAKERELFFDHLRDTYDLDGGKILKAGRAATQDASFLVHGMFNITDSTSIFFSGNTHFRKGSAFGNYRLPNQPTEVVSGLYPFGFLPEIQSSISNNFFVTGLRRNFGKWIAEISNTYGNNSIKFNVNGTNNPSLGILSPNYFSAGRLIYTQNVVKFDLSGALISGKFIKTNLRAGAEVRSENYQILKGEEASYKGSGAIGFPGFQPENELNEWRRNFGTFLNLENKYKRNNLIIKTSSGIRYERYSDFEDKPLVFQFAGRVTQTNIMEGLSLSIRGSLNKGFRAPSLQQRFFNNRSTQRSGSLENVYTFNNLSTIARQLGFQSLSPEESTNYNFGFEADFSKNSGKTKITVSLDRYFIAIKNRIVLSGRFKAENLSQDPSVKAQKDYFNTFLTTNGYAVAQGFINGIETTTTGLDAFLNFHREIDNRNSFNISWRGNFFDPNAQQEVSKQQNSNKALIDENYLPKLFIGRDSILFDREQITRYEDGQSQWRSVVYANWEHTFKNKNWALRVDASWNAFGEVASAQNSERPEDFDSVYKVVDVMLALRFKNFSLSFGGNNLLNAKPDTNSDQDSGRFPYSRRVQQFGMAGGMWFTRLYIDL